LIIIMLKVLGLAAGVCLLFLLGAWILGEKGLTVRPGTKKFAALFTKKELFNPKIFLHGYFYLRWLDIYVRAGRNTLNKIPVIGPWIVYWLIGETYHGKTIPTELAKALVSVKKSISVKDLTEQVIPFPVAREIVVEAGPEIALTECPCRASRDNPCQPTQVCMTVGRPFVEFMLEHNPHKTRRVTTQEAIELLEAEHNRGHLHTAWFKDATAGRFWAICNCCRCCCAGFDLMKKNIDIIIPSGYIAVFDTDNCVQCSKCVKACPFEAIRPAENAVELIWDKCKGCGVCVGACPKGLISLKLDSAKGKPLDIRAL